MVARTQAVGAGACLAVPLRIVALVVSHAPLPQEEAVLPGCARAAAGIGPRVEIHRRLAGPRSIAHLWPLSRHPALIPQGAAFVKRWGVAGLFRGRFCGPLRASVPLVAGLCAMPCWRFPCANVSAACVWAAVRLTLGDTGAQILPW